MRKKVEDKNRVYKPIPYNPQIYNHLFKSYLTPNRIIIPRSSMSN
nr:MAG TPA: hypothetical protein [Caudoviricetes sp.]